MKNKNCLVLFGVLALATMGACAKQQVKTAKVGDMKAIYFDYDRSDIKSEFVSVLKNNAEYLRGHEKKNAVIEGHCDERGTAEYNIALGDRRARSAKNFLVNAGISGGRLATISYGEEKAVASCHDESCWGKNRRAEFKNK